jgi:hypothetical protein
MNLQMGLRSRNTLNNVGNGRRPVGIGALEFRVFKALFCLYTEDAPGLQFRKVL